MLTATKLLFTHHLPFSILTNIILAIWSAICAAISTFVEHIILRFSQHSLKPLCKHAPSLSQPPRCSFPLHRSLLSPTTSHKLTIVLDLDETLVCTYPSSRIPKWLASSTRTNQSHIHNLQYSKAPGPFNTIAIYERPGLHKFLQQASQFAELVLFTAGQESYAQPVVEILDPHHTIFSAVLYRDSTIHYLSKDVKDLSRLGRDMARVVMVDNNPYSFLLQPANGVPVAPYHGDPADEQLLDVVLPLLQGLAQLNDVRSVLGPTFRMASWFRSKGLKLPEGCGSTS